MTTNHLKAFFLFKFSFQNTRKALIVLMVGFILTIAAAFYSARQEATKEKNEFSLIGNEIKTKISARLHAHAQLLRTGAAFFAASDTVTRKSWKTFNESAKIELNLPGILGLGFSVLIPENQLQEHIQRIRREGFPDYSLRPAGVRPVYTSIIFLEPFSGRNLRAFGYDMFSDSTRRKAMEKSRDSDMAVLSGRVTLVQETNKDVQAGTLMYVPVYRNGMPVNTVEQRREAIIGWVYNPYRMNDLMKGILGQWGMISKYRIHLQIYEDSLSTQTIMFDSQANEALNQDDTPSRSVSLPVDFNEKKWLLVFTQTQDQSSVSSKIAIVATVGIAISLLLFALSLSLFNTFSRAQGIASKLTLDLKESEDRFKMLLNSTTEGIYGIGLQGNCTFSNTACHQLLGYESSGQIIGKNMHNLIHHSHADGRAIDEKKCRIYGSFQKGERIHVADEVFWRADGTSFPVEYWSNPFFINGKIEGAVVTFFDITERKLMEDKILAARYEAERANLAKSNFLSRVSHELRTPLNSILGFAQLMEMNGPSPAQGKAVKHILTSGKHLLNLIDVVLDISGIESGNLLFSPEAVRVDGIILEVLVAEAPLAAGRNIDMRLEPSPANDLFVWADRKRLKQVLHNLIDNAIKYNREGGSVTIKTELMSTESPGKSQVRISINDTGLGISHGDLPKLFNPFERIGAENTETEGTGLGLTLVKKLMDSMGGHVGVDTMPGEGSTFRIELPVA
jgi:PAS domain S-box-containing protein